MTDFSSRRVAVIGGGTSEEHDVSLSSAAAIVRAVTELGHTAVPLTINRAGSWKNADGDELSPAEAVTVMTSCDVAFPVLHGRDGEDGAVAGLLRLIGVPFVGSPVRAGALGMDKWVTKLVAESVGIATAPAVVVRRGMPIPRTGFDLPFVVKPVSGGSSNGVSVVRDTGDLQAAVDSACAADDMALIESFVDGREIDIALFRDHQGTLRAGATLGIGVAAGAVFDREQKYDGTAAFTVPAQLTSEEAVSIERAARVLYDELGCSGVSRFDFFVTSTGVVLNEVNTSPGFTEQSQVPRMFAATGLGYADLVATLLDAAPGVLDQRREGMVTR